MPFTVGDYRGVLVPLVTPFEGERVDAGALADLVQRLLAAGVSGFLVLGTTGEAPHLTDDEAEGVVRAVVRAAGGRVPVLAGSGRHSTSLTCAATWRLADAGADAALVLTPYYYRARMDGAALCRHYASVAAAAPIPVFVYHMPEVTGLDLDAAALAAIVGIANVWGFKDSSSVGGPLAETLRHVCTCGLVGSGARFLEGLEAGAAGGILALANVIPEVCLGIHAAWSAGDGGAATEKQRLAAQFGAVLRGWGVPGLKHVLSLRGVCVGAPRAPLDMPPPEVRSRLEVALRAALGGEMSPLGAAAV